MAAAAADLGAGSVAGSAAAMRLAAAAGTTPHAAASEAASAAALALAAHHTSSEGEAGQLLGALHRRREPRLELRFYAGEPGLTSSTAVAAGFRSARPQFRMLSQTCRSRRCGYL